MVKKALILLTSTLFWGAPSFADSPSNNCEDISQLILKKYATFEETIKANDGRLTSVQIEEVSALLNLSCSPQFASCGFSVCKPLDTPNSGKPELEGPNSLPDQTTSKTENNSNKLPWVTSEMNCEDFLGQLKTRFQTGSLKEKQKKELKVALELACGDKFKHCNFEACKKK